MSKIKLTYLNIKGGRAEPIRMAFSMGNIDFEDIRITFPEFGKMREGFPLKAIPTMDVDGAAYTQGNSMIRYAGKLAGLYPNDSWQAFLCDEILDAVEDTSHALVKTFGLEGQELKAAREKLASETYTHFLRFFDKRLKDAGGLYFADNRLTVADLKLFCWIRSLNSGILDHVPTDLVENIAPNLNMHMNRVAEDSRVSAYLNK